MPLSNSFIRTAIALILAAATLPATAQEAAEPDMSRLTAALGGKQPDSIAETPLPGLYEVVLGSQVLYLSEDGRYAIQGDVVDLASASNLTEQRRNTLRVSAIDAAGEDSMIVFAPEGDTAYTVTVFTDIDCGYCRKLHSEIESYNERGIAVRYMAFPRAGLNSESYDKAVSAWCADDPQDAITRAKRGEAIEPRSCENPVARHYQLGQQLGVRGTPSIILSSGEMVPGYVPADRLVQTLASAKAAAD